MTQITKEKLHNVPVTECNAWWTFAVERLLNRLICRLWHGGSSGGRPKVFSVCLCVGVCFKSYNQTENTETRKHWSAAVGQWLSEAVQPDSEDSGVSEVSGVSGVSGVETSWLRSSWAQLRPPCSLLAGAGDSRPHKQTSRRSWTLSHCRPFRSQMNSGIIWPLWQICACVVLFKPLLKFPPIRASRGRHLTFGLTNVM